MRVQKRTRVLGVQVVLLLGLIVVSLAGCAAPVPAPVVETRIQVERVTLPPGLLSCMAEPPVPDMTLQSQVADYWVRLEIAGADCRDTVSAIAQIENAAAAAK
jgi:hypothetical protein